MKAELTYRGEYLFEAKAREHAVTLDGDKGGGASPKELFLASIAGCAGMDVAGLMKKHKLVPDSLRIHAVATARDEHPRVFPSIEITFEFKGEGLPAEKLIEAADLSFTRYCGVAAMVAVPIYYTVVLNGEIEHRATAKF